MLAGATGFIGSHLVAAMLEKDFNIVVLKRSTDSFGKIDQYKERIKFYNADTQGFNQPFVDNKVDFVINLVTNFGRSKDNNPSDIADANIVYGLKLAESSIAAGVKYFFNVDSALDPKVNLYAYTKRVFREILEKYLSDKIVIMNLKLEHVYGENDALFKFIPMVVDKMKKNETVEMSRGEQQLDFVYIKDCVDAFIYLIENADKYQKQFNFFEIGSGETVPLKFFVEEIKRKTKSKSEIIFGAVAYRPDEQMYSKADLSKIRGWKPKYSLDFGIDQIIK